MPDRVHTVPQGDVLDEEPGGHRAVSFCCRRSGSRGRRDLDDRDFVAAVRRRCRHRISSAAGAERRCRVRNRVRCLCGAVVVVRRRTDLSVCVSVALGRLCLYHFAVVEDRRTHSLPAAFSGGHRLYLSRFVAVEDRRDVLNHRRVVISSSDSRRLRLMHRICPSPCERVFLATESSHVRSHAATDEEVVFGRLHHRWESAIDSCRLVTARQDTTT